MRWPLAPSELRELTPGAMSSTSLNARRALIGAARNKSPSTVIVLVGRPVDTIGDSPDTVTVSDSVPRSEEHTSELQSQSNLVCRLLLEKKKKNITSTTTRTP